MARTERRNRDLERARSAAEHANRSKTTFLANVSHELRTPLNAIIGFSELMQTETFGAIGQPRYREYVADIHASGKHLLMIINDILDMAKIETGRCWRTAARCARSCSTCCRTRSSSRRRPAPSRCARRGWRAARSSCRTGIGIAPEHIATVLEPFGQVANQFNRDHDGTGLGLPLARAFAALHGAAFEIASAVGQGTTVRVRFPAARAIAPRRPPPVIPEGLARDGPPREAVRDGLGGGHPVGSFQPARAVVAADKPV